MYFLHAFKTARAYANVNYLIDKKRLVSPKHAYQLANVNVISRNPLDMQL